MLAAAVLARLRIGPPEVGLLAGITLLGLVNPGITSDILRFPHSIDWDVYVEASKRLGTDRLYEWPGGYEWCEHCVFRYSPVFAWLIDRIEPMGVAGWRFLHMAVVPLLGAPVGVLAALSWPLWQDIQAGNVVTFAVVLGALGIRGKRWAAVGYLVLALLTPRPFLLPVAVWLLWKWPGLRVPVAVLASAHLVLVLATGYLEPWVAAMLGPNLDQGAAYDYGPARLIGPSWALVGVPLSAWLTYRGHLGLASLAIQPYWLGYYLLMVLLELVPKAERREGR